jgi:hypothetical protein
MIPSKTISCDLSFETIPFSKRFIRKWFVYPLLNYVVPKSMVMAYLSKSKSAFLKELLRGPGSWRTMMLSYEREMPTDAMDRWIYEHGSFPVGLRNRKKMVVHLLAQLIEEHLLDGEVDIVTVGAGTGIHTIEGMARVSSEKVRAHLFDLDDQAFEIGEAIGHKHGVGHRVKFIKADVAHLPQYVAVKPQILEMIGIAEYLSDEQLVRLFSQLRSLTSDNSCVIMSTLVPSHGLDNFFKRALGFHLYYRNTQQMLALLAQCGFDHFSVAYEPTHLYSIVIGRKVSHNTPLKERVKS